MVVATPPTILYLTWYLFSVTVEPLVLTSVSPQLMVILLVIPFGVAEVIKVFEKPDKEQKSKINIFNMLIAVLKDFLIFLILLADYQSLEHCSPKNRKDLLFSH